MSRIARIVTAAALALGVSLVSGASLAGAQEMEHGRSRPAALSVWR